MTSTAWSATPRVLCPFGRRPETDLSVLVWQKAGGTMNKQVVWYLDHTLISAVRRTLDRRALSRTDAPNLIQLAIALVFADRLMLNGFETQYVAQNSRQVISNLIELGVEKETISFSVDGKEQYARCCILAADRLASALNRFGIVGSIDFTASRPELSREQIEYEKELKHLINTGASGAHLVYAEPRTAADAAGYMITASQLLWNAVTGHHPNRKLSNKSGKGRWTHRQIKELVVLTRIFLNSALSDMHNSLYLPAVGRRRMMCDPIDVLGIIREIHRSDNKAADLCRLGVPLVERLLLERSKGEPHAVIDVALELREKSWELRALLAEVGDRSRTESEDVKQTIAQLKSALEYYTNRTIKPVRVKFTAPLTVEVELSLPLIRQWWTARHYKQLLSVLIYACCMEPQTELQQHEHFLRLQRNCHWAA